MAKKSFAPWSAETAQGIKTDPVNSNIEVKQEVIPAVNVGTVNTNTGEWIGVATSDEIFFGTTIHSAIGNGETVLAPENNIRNYIDMTGFKHIQFALKPSRAGNYAIATVMGPATNSYANLSPVNAGADLKGNQSQATPQDFEDIFYDSAEAMTADVWNIFMIKDILSDQKLLQFKVVNNSGGISTMEFAFMRLV